MNLTLLFATIVPYLCLIAVAIGNLRRVKRESAKVMIVIDPIAEPERWKAACDAAPVINGVMWMPDIWIKSERGIFKPDGASHAATPPKPMVAKPRCE